MKILFSVSGMTCAACSARVEKVTRAIEGVEKAEVNLLSGKMTVYATNQNVADGVIKAVSAAGYEATLGLTKKVKVKSEERTGCRIIISSVLLVILMYFTMGQMLHLPMPKWYVGAENTLVATLLQLFLAMPIILLNSGYFKRGLKALWHRSPNMDSLIAVGSGASLLYSVAVLFVMAYFAGHGNIQRADTLRHELYFESAAMILTLISVGKFLEQRAKGKTGDAVRKLMELAPDRAVVLRDGNEMELPADQVQVGDILVVRSGAGISADGVVVDGHGAVDESALTGESVPVFKKIGDRVSAATINREGYLQIRVEKVGQDTILSQIIRMVEEAGGSKAPIARLADKIAGIFVPVVMAIAALVFAAWLIVGKTLAFALTAGVSVLVISCPCALGLATPVAIMVGTGRGASIGVLFKNATSLEQLHGVDTVVFDKTGTLTTGCPGVTDVMPHNISEQNLLCVAAALEKRSEHPFAKAILRKADGLKLSNAERFEVFPGMGVSAMIDGVRYYGGNKRLMEQFEIAVPNFETIAAEGKTPLYFASENCYLGMIAATDQLKPEAEAAVKLIKKLGLKIVMLTGDNKQTAEYIGQLAGVDEVISQVMPGEKAGVICRLQEQGSRVLMIGDGINDAPALTAADVGMAVGTGTDIAMESADVVLMRDSLLCVYDGISLSKTTIRNIKQNLFWAFFYNILGIPMAALGLLSPMIGAACMSMSSLFVVTNALRLRLFKTNTTQVETFDNVEEKNMEIVITVHGMMCTHCQARVESVCKAMAGVTNAVVDLKAKTVTVTGTPDVVALKKAITDAGYEVMD